MTLTPACPTIDALLHAYLHGELSPVVVAAASLQRISMDRTTAVWISRAPQSTVLQRAAELQAELTHDPQAALRRWPLLGIPFAVKDNIDVAGLPTTAACPAFAYTPTRSATAVELLEDAGAIVIGKTNLDQFATGLVGMRTPYGETTSPFNPLYVSGGSSSGSALATARGQVAFALGTDTAGSGRVPAAFCNLVGLKPTPGLVSNRGVVPACRSLDCVSVFAHTVADAWRVLAVIAQRDNVLIKPPPAMGTLPRGIRIGIPLEPEFYGDRQAASAFEAAMAGIQDPLAQSITTLDLRCFHEVATLLYEGPWIAERRAALGDFFAAHGNEMDPIVHQIIAVADSKSAVETFNGQYRLEELRNDCDAIWRNVDVLVVPTTPTTLTKARVAAEPIASNNQLGIYTNFVNLLGLAALALPGPFREDGLPAGVTLIGPGGSDHRLAELARHLEPRLHLRLGTTAMQPPRCGEILPPLPFHEATVDVAVVGAHLKGLPLNWQLLERSAQLKETTTTAPRYRLFGLPGTVPPKPGLVPVRAGGAAIAVEIWEMPLRNFGSFVSSIPPPLGIGTLQLEGGREVKGFVCDSTALDDATDITAFGGWRAYLASPQGGDQISSSA